MDKESLLELQKLDCNCNDCVYMARNLEKFKSKDHLYEDNKKASHRINYGTCLKFAKHITFIPNIIQLHTQDCFKHRKE